MIFSLPDAGNEMLQFAVDLSLEWDTRDMGLERILLIPKRKEEGENGISHAKGQKRLAADVGGAMWLERDPHLHSHMRLDDNDRELAGRQQRTKAALLAGIRTL